MIRLIATDMDGTLLDSRKQLPEGFSGILRELKANRIRLAIASGRQYYNLRAYFSREEAEDLFFLLENGAAIFENEQPLFFRELDPSLLPETIEAIRGIRGVHPVVCGLRSAYIENTEEFFVRNVKLYYQKLEVLPDVLDGAKSDHICKLAAFDAENAEQRTLPEMKRFSDRFNVVLSGRMWVDLMSHGTDKGTALRVLQTRLRISPEETMAFGDYLNDAGMMHSCRYSFAMENAHPDLKKLCAYQTESNDDNGVLNAIRRFRALILPEATA